MNFISAIDSTASALNAEKVRMDIVAENIANANTTRDLDGKPYQRKMVSFEAMVSPGNKGESGVKVSAVTNDNSEGAAVYNPSHPHAGPDGMVHMPNVNISTEMVDLMSASRAYEANLSVIRNSRQMAMKALTIGR